MRTEQITAIPLGAVWGHSSKAGSRRFVIFCVGQEPRVTQAFRAWATAQGIAFKSLQGCYLGQEEQSFIVSEADFGRVAHWTREQESVLMLGPCDARDRRLATLLFRDGTRHELGLLRGVRREVALACDSWTYDPMQDAYFVAREH